MLPFLPTASCKTLAEFLVFVYGAYPNRFYLRIYALLNFVTRSIYLPKLLFVLHCVMLLELGDDFLKIATLFSVTGISKNLSSIETP